MVYRWESVNNELANIFFKPADIYLETSDFLMSDEKSRPLENSQFTNDTDLNNIHLFL